MGSGNLKSCFKAVIRAIVEIIHVPVIGKAAEVDDEK